MYFIVEFKIILLSLPISGTSKNSIRTNKICNTPSGQVDISVNVEPWTIRHDFLDAMQIGCKKNFLTLLCSAIVYGTGKALEGLAQRLGAEEMKTGIHGVYTDSVSFVWDLVLLLKNTFVQKKVQHNNFLFSSSCLWRMKFLKGSYMFI